MAGAIAKRVSMNGVIAKHNSILQPLTVLNLEERRLFSFCLQYYDSRKDAENPTLFSVPIEKIKETFPEYKDYKPNILFKKLMDAANGIQSKGYQPDPGSRFVVWWFTSLDLRDGVNVKFSLSQYAMPYFLNLSRDFISYHMADVQLMNKPTAWNLYEYLKEKFENGRHPEWKEDVDILKERLGALDKYPRFADFDKRCIKTPQEDINEHTDLHFDYDKMKRGKTVVRIIFRVFKKCSDPSVIDTEDLAKTLQRELLNSGLSNSIIEKFVNAAVEQSKIPEILKKIPDAKRSHTKNGKGPWAAYLTGVLNNELLQGNLFSSETMWPRNIHAEQDNCWKSANTYGCKFVGLMGTKDSCKGCEHNRD